MSTYTPIASTTLASASNSVVLQTIPQSYTDLILAISYSQNASTTLTSIRYRFNSDTSSNYQATGFQDGSLAWNYVNQTNVEVAYQAFTGQSQIVSNIHNYANTNVFKTLITRDANAGQLTQYYGGLWRSTSGISSITITCDAGSFAAGSTFNLYGIANAGITNVAKATGGDIVTTDGTYWYHAFLSSGVFAPTQVLNADVLVVAGGGGSAQDGGGGGAGGLQGFTSQSLSVQNYAITVGAGGVGSGQSVSNGSNSQFGSLTASIGGGGSTYRAAPNSGGSGGGASAFYTGSGGAGTAGQGNAGGGSSGGNFSGGGGGAGAAGQAAQGAIGGTGGDGVSTYSSWGLATSTGDNRSGTVWYAGGGGGWYGAPAGGKGGGGTSTNGTANTGGGAGGYIYSGGSGIVIVRYAV